MRHRRIQPRQHSQQRLLEQGHDDTDQCGWDEHWHGAAQFKRPQHGADEQRVELPGLEHFRRRRMGDARGRDTSRVAVAADAVLKCFGLSTRRQASCYF